MKETIIPIISLLISLTSVLITIITFKQKNKQNQRQVGKNEGLIISDIGYIKECVDRLEKTLNTINDKNHLLDIRITRIEEKLRTGDNK